MKPVKEPNVSEQPPMIAPQEVTDEQIVQALNRLTTKGSAAAISVEDIVVEYRNIIMMIMNQKNQEIKALKEALAKKDIEKKLP